MNSTKLPLGFLLLTTVAPVFLNAQVDTGTIRGVVTDISDTAIRGAVVSAIQEGTGLTLSARTAVDGGYTFAPARIGTYSISVSFAGFEKVTRSNVVLHVQENVVVDFHLKPGR